MAMVNIVLYSSKVGFGVWFPKLPYFTGGKVGQLSYPKGGLYCSKAESRVPCRLVVVIVSNPTFIELCLVVLGLCCG